MGGRTDLRPSLILKEELFIYSWGGSRSEVAHIHADNRLVGQNIVVLVGRDERGENSGLCLQRLQSAELAQYAVVVSGTLTADMTGMRQMAGTLVALFLREHPCFVQVEAGKNEHRQVNCQQHPGRYPAPNIHFHAAKLRLSEHNTK